jgi:hypothetical protein
MESYTDAFLRNSPDLGEASQQGNGDNCGTHLERKDWKNNKYRKIRKEMTEISFLKRRSVQRLCIWAVSSLIFDPTFRVLINQGISPRKPLFISPRGIEVNTKQQSNQALCPSSVH